MASFLGVVAVYEASNTVDLSTAGLYGFTTDTFAAAMNVPAGAVLVAFGVPTGFFVDSPSPPDCHRGANTSWTLRGPFLYELKSSKIAGGAITHTPAGSGTNGGGSFQDSDWLTVAVLGGGRLVAPLMIGDTLRAVWAGPGPEYFPEQTVRCKIKLRTVVVVAIGGVKPAADGSLDRSEFVNAAGNTSHDNLAVAGPSCHQVYNPPGPRPVAQPNDDNLPFFPSIPLPFAIGLTADRPHNAFTPQAGWVQPWTYDQAGGAGPRLRILYKTPSANGPVLGSYGVSTPWADAVIGFDTMGRCGPCRRGSGSHSGGSHGCGGS